MVEKIEKVIAEKVKHLGNMTEMYKLYDYAYEQSKKHNVQSPEANKNIRKREVRQMNNLKNKITSLLKEVELSLDELIHNNNSLKKQ